MSGGFTGARWRCMRAVQRAHAGKPIGAGTGGGAAYGSGVIFGDLVPWDALWVSVLLIVRVKSLEF